MNSDSPSAPRGLRARQREGTSRAILEAAEEVFAEQGLDAPMERIARRAEVAVGTLYNHFVDRAALMEALFENRRRAMHERVDDALARTATLPFRARLQEVVDAIVIVPPDALRVRRMLLAEAPPYKLPTSATFEKFEPLFAQGRKEKALRADVFGMQIRALHALLFVAVRTAVEDGDAASLRALADEIVRQFLDGATP